MGACPRPFDEPVGEERRARHPEHEIGNAEGVAAGEPGETDRPAPDEGDALRDHEGEALGDRGGAERHDQRGDAQHGDAVAVQRAQHNADADRSRYRDGRRILRMDQPAADDRREARHFRDGEVEFGHAEGEREAEREDGEEARILQHIDDVHGAGEIRREDQEEQDQREAGERRAIASDQFARVDAAQAQLPFFAIISAGALLRIAGMKRPLRRACRVGEAGQRGRVLRQCDEIGRDRG